MTYSLTSLHSGANDADMLVVVEREEDSPSWKARKDLDGVYDAARNYINPCRLRSSTFRLLIHTNLSLCLLLLLSKSHGQPSIIMGHQMRRKVNLDLAN